ncbi:conserved hypothetical protein [Ricinus communis]|uniref:Uncharacterized protein n=1 Tax=Ricinus communis TaxID=3988 RepID=B9SAV7_RICCO|nr:conserved hypothetical protein [Ricinus communis]
MGVSFLLFIIKRNRRYENAEGREASKGNENVKTRSLEENKMVGRVTHRSGAEPSQFGNLKPCPVLMVSKVPWFGVFLTVGGGKLLLACAVTLCINLYDFH